MLKIKCIWNLSKIDLVLKVLTPGDQIYKIFHICNFGLKEINGWKCQMKFKRVPLLWEPEEESMSKPCMHRTDKKCWQELTRHFIHDDVQQNTKEY